MVKATGNIDLWWGALSDLECEHESYLSVLTEDEKSRMRRYRFTRRGRTFALIRGWLRRALATYWGEDPAQLQIDYEANGKPVLVQPVPKPGKHRLEFNLSHSGDHFVLAVTWGSRLGVDLERVCRIDHIDTIARMYFSKSDYEAFHRAKERKHQRFFELWTQLEARYKAFGSDYFEMGDGAHSLQEQSHYCWTWEPDPGYIASLISESGDKALRWVVWKGTSERW